MGLGGRAHVFTDHFSLNFADSLMRRHAVRVENVRPRPRSYDSVSDPDAEP